MKNIVNENFWFKVALKMSDVLFGLFDDDWAMAWIADNFTKEEQEIIYEKFGF
jgi:hypothetical protein